MQGDLALAGVKWRYLGRSACRFSSLRISSAKASSRLEFAQNAIPFFGGQLVKVVKAGGSEDQIDKAVIEFALATVVVESCLGVSDEDLLGRHFNLVVYDDGLVRYDRLDA